MTVLKSFEWTSSEEEVLYIFHIIGIAEALNCKFAIFNHFNETTHKAKFAIEFPSLEELNEFRLFTEIRMTFDNWQNISSNEFYENSWIFASDKHNSVETKMVIAFMHKWSNYPLGIGKGLEILLVPYNFEANAYHLKHIMSKMPSVSFESLKTASVPTLQQVKQVIHDSISDSGSITYFQFETYWDAKLVIDSAKVFVIAHENVEGDNPRHFFAFRGSIDLIKLVTQKLANSFGPMILVSVYSYNQPILIIPQVLDP